MCCFAVLSQQQATLLQKESVICFFRLPDTPKNTKFSWFQPPAQMTGLDDSLTPVAVVLNVLGEPCEAVFAVAYQRAFKHVIHKHRSTNHV